MARPAGPIRVFLVDDHAIVRQGLRRLIEDEPDLRVVGEAAHGREVLLAEGKDEWDVLLLDLSLPRVSGIEVLRRLRREMPALRIVVLSAFPEEQYAAYVLREGAVGYLHKDRGPAELMRALRAAAAGETYVSPAVLAQVASGQGGLPHERLSGREYQVFTLLIHGRSVTEVAAELDISASTASNHVARIKEKLGVGTIGEVINYAHRAGLVDGT
jgi:DNA-binding NarL/FixJ family response regulator